MNSKIQFWEWNYLQIGTQLHTRNMPNVTKWPCVDVRPANDSLSDIDDMKILALFYISKTGQFIHGCDGKEYDKLCMKDVQAHYGLSTCVYLCPGNDSKTVMCTLPLNFMCTLPGLIGIVFTKTGMIG